MTTAGVAAAEELSLFSTDRPQLDSNADDRLMKEVRMMNAQTLAICLVGIMVQMPGLEGQSRSGYRDFALASDVASISTLAGVASSETKTIHQRPAVLQDLEWRPSRWVGGSTSTDPVDTIIFSFYNDRLFKLVVDYDRERTVGMTDADMIEAISAVYGAPVKGMAGALRVPSGVDAEWGSPVARWGDAEHAVALYRISSYREAFRLIVADPALDDLARKAAVQAARLDAQEAPQREVARQKKERDDGRAAAEKARVENKRGFRP